jgi:hypothetical protein
MTESERDEALQLGVDAGFIFAERDGAFWTLKDERFSVDCFIRLIALARQPLLDAINEHLVNLREMFEAALPQVSDGVLRERMRAWLAAAPNPEERNG